MSRLDSHCSNDIAWKVWLVVKSAKCDGKNVPTSAAPKVLSTASRGTAPGVVVADAMVSAQYGRLSANLMSSTYNTSADPKVAVCL